MFSKISSLTCGIPWLMTLSICKRIQKRGLELASKQQMMLSFPASHNVGLRELPDGPEKMLSNQFKKCQTLVSS